MSRRLAAVCFVSLILIPANLLAQKKDPLSSFTFALKVSGVGDGQFEQARRNGVIILYDKSSKEVARWTIISAWPSAIAIETDEDTGDPLEAITLAVDASHRQ